METLKKAISDYQKKKSAGMEILKKAILDYQKKKNDIFLEVTGIELIPKAVQLTKSELNEESVEAIIDSFEPRDKLTNVNCLHCNIYEECVNCPFSTIDNSCNEKHSSYYRVHEELNKTKIFPPVYKALKDEGVKLKEEILNYQERRGY